MTDERTLKPFQAPLTKNNGESIRKAKRKSIIQIDVDFVRKNLDHFSCLYCVDSSLRESANSYIDSFVKTRTHKGERRAVDLYKEFRNFWKVLILGGSPTPLKYAKAWEGYPYVLMPFQKVLKREDPNEIRFVLTVLGFYLVQKTHQVPPDTSTITEWPDNISPKFLHKIKEFLLIDEQFKNFKLSFAENSKVRVTGAQSIHCQSFYSASLELQSLRKDSKTLEAVKYLNDRYDRWHLNEIIDNTDNSSRHVPKTSALRRLSVLREPGNKNRQVTLGDFWSQNALLPLHEELMGFLSELPEDCTFTASEQIKQLSETTNDQYTTCIDLSEFTNLLPFSIQKVVLKHLCQDDLFVEAWAHLMKLPVEYNNKMLYFSRGQPMGLLSSWAMASLTHHVLVRYVKWASKCDFRSFYKLYGDDNIFVGKTFADNYVRLMESLNIPFSKSKTISSPKGGFEFCKKIYFKGVNLTPLSWKILQIEDLALRHVELTRTLLPQFDLPKIEEYTKKLWPSERSLDWNVLVVYDQLIASQEVKAPVMEVLTHDWSAYLRVARVLLAVKRRENMIDQISSLCLHNIRAFRVALRGHPHTKVRGMVTKSTESVFHIMMLQAIRDLGLNPVEFYQTLARSTNIDDEDKIHIDWDILGMKDFKTMDFFVTDPRKRFQSNRQRIVVETFNFLKSLVDASGETPENASLKTQIEVWFEAKLNQFRPWDTDDLERKIRERLVAIAPALVDWCPAHGAGSLVYVFPDWIDL